MSDLIVLLGIKPFSRPKFISFMCACPMPRHVVTDEREGGQVHCPRKREREAHFNLGAMVVGLLHAYLKEGKEGKGK